MKERASFALSFSLGVDRILSTAPIDRNVHHHARVGGFGHSALWWSCATLLSALTLPWSRSATRVLEYDAAVIGARLITQSWLVAAAVVLAGGLLFLSRNPLPSRREGRLMFIGAVGGLAASAVHVVVNGQPFGVGAAATALGFLTVAGLALSYSGWLRAEPFAGGAIVWMAAFVAVFIVYPLIMVLVNSVWVNGAFTLDEFLRTLRSPAFFLLENPWTDFSERDMARKFGLLGAVLGFLWQWAAHRRAPIHPGRMLLRTLAAGLTAYCTSALITGFGALRNSVLLAASVGGISTALGLSFALLAGRSRFPIRKLMGPFSTLSIITPPFVLGLAMIYMFGRQGFVTSQLLGLSTSAFFGPLGVGMAQVLAFTPVAYLVLTGVVQSLDGMLEEAAQTLGASRWHTFRTVTWPLLRPGIANAFLLTVIESLADFGNPLLLGGGVPFLPTEVFYAIEGRFNQHEAAVYGVLLVTMTIGVFLVQRYWIGKTSYVTVTGKPSQTGSVSLPSWLEYPMLGAFVLWTVLGVGLYASVFFGSFVKLWGFNNTFTLEHYEALRISGLGVFVNTVRLAAIAAVPSALIGFLIAYVVGRLDFPGRSALEFSSMLSFAVPGTVMGIGYVLAFHHGPLKLTGTELIIILAFVFRNMPVGIRSGLAALAQIDRSLEEASTTLRASNVTTLRRVLFPLLVPAVVSGLMFAFVRGMTAVSQVIFLATPQTNLATVLILSWIGYGNIGIGAALSSVLLASMALVVLLLNFLLHRADPNRSRRSLDLR